MGILFIMYLLAFSVYIIGICISCDNEIWVANKELSPKDIRLGFVWPIRLVLWFIIGITWIVHDLLKGFLLAFNFRYGKTKTYDKIDRWFYKRL